jgi:predicted AAA+ superfamily ATPase
VELIARPDYDRRIDALTDKPLIKVLTGIRRCGKSSLLTLTADRLRARGVPPERVIHLDFDLAASAGLRTAAALSDHLAERMSHPGRHYVLIDEVQEVDGWERVANSLLAEGRADIFLTGSNSRLLSSELATYIAGRYATVEVSPLSFAEYSAFEAARAASGASSGDGLFERYLRRGGFPGLFGAALDDDQHYRAVRDIYASALIRDTITRHAIRNVDLLQRVAAFALGNVGNPFSARSVSRFVKSEGRRADPETVIAYLRALMEAFILGHAPAYDLRGKALMTVNGKWFAGDHALIWALFGYQDHLVPGVAENIVWAELRRRGYEVSVGRLGAQEVDFVADRSGDRVYVQVATTVIGSDELRRREFGPLEKIRDAYPKFVVSLDRLAGGNQNGVKHVYLPHFLLGSDF